MTEETPRQPEQTMSFRSPLLMNSHDTAVVVIDVQEKLIGHIADHKRISWNISRILAGAKALNVKVCATEQYPKGLGPTTPAIAESIKADSPFEIETKTMFSCRECSQLVSAISESGIHNLMLVGIETHVCVAQSALDLLSAGFNIFVCVDAVGSRSSVDHRIGLRRMENSGVTLTTTEAALFEWCENANHPEFKTISRMIQEPGPSE